MQSTRIPFEVIGYEVTARQGEGALAAQLDVQGDALELSAVAREDAEIERSNVVLRHAFASDEMVLCNGYQSWTDTVERPAWASVRGLHGVPKRLIERYAIDGGGDYAFTKYSRKSGEQHGYTYATFRRGEQLALVGSLDESHGFTLIRTNAARGEVTLETEPPLRTIRAGERVVLGRYAITHGAIEECYDEYFKLAGISARPVKPLVGYTSWYRHYGGITESKLLHDLAGLSVMGSKAVHDLFQIDDGYCKVGDWLELDRAKFPQGLAAIAAAARKRGFLPGLWVAPFVCERDSRVFNERSEWLLRDGEGNPVRSGPQWSGGYALDTRNTEVRSYVLDVLQTMTSDWGFKLLKADFLYAACMRPHDGMNRGELMADAMALLRKGAGEDVLLLGCGVPLGSAFGVVDYCRIGCDVGLDWNDKVHMRLLHRERVSTKNSLSNTYGRAPLDGRAFGNDPDVFFLRKDVKLTDAQRDELLFANADLGSVFLTSDDQSQWTEGMRDRYRKALRVFLGE